MAHASRSLTSEFQGTSPPTCAGASAGEGNGSRWRGLALWGHLTAAGVAATATAPSLLGWTGLPEKRPLRARNGLTGLAMPDRWLRKWFSQQGKR